MKVPYFSQYHSREVEEWFVRLLEEPWRVLFKTLRPDIHHEDTGVRLMTLIAKVEANYQYTTSDLLWTFMDAQKKNHPWNELQVVTTCGVNYIRMFVGPDSLLGDKEATFYNFAMAGWLDHSNYREYWTVRLREKGLIRS